jgi:hypothetical protein
MAEAKLGIVTPVGSSRLLGCETGGNVRCGRPSCDEDLLFDDLLCESLSISKEKLKRSQNASSASKDFTECKPTVAGDNSVNG